MGVSRHAQVHRGTGRNTGCIGGRIADSLINEYPLTLECRVVSFEDGMLIGQVINQGAADSILTDGKVDLTKLKPIVFDNAALTYRTIGGEVGKAWGAGKKFINE